MCPRCELFALLFGLGGFVVGFLLCFWFRIRPHGDATGP